MTAAASVAFHDPEGRRYGVPTWPWGAAPGHLATRTQLRTRGLRPGGPVVGQILWRSRLAHRRGWVRVAFLYEVAAARPRRPPTPPLLRAREGPRAARRTCSRCGIDVGYIPPRRLGCCLECADPWELDHLAA